MVQRKSSVLSPDSLRRDRPVRMCVGCRQRAGTDALVRVVAREVDGTPSISVDFSRTMSGRGAWLHPSAECVSAAVRRRAFGPALRTPRLIVQPDDLADVIGFAPDPAEITDDSRLPREPEQAAEDMSTP